MDIVIFSGVVIATSVFIYVCDRSPRGWLHARRHKNHVQDNGTVTKDGCN